MIGIPCLPEPPDGMSTCRYCGAVNPYWLQHFQDEPPFRCAPGAVHADGCEWLEVNNPDECPF